MLSIKNILLFATAISATVITRQTSVIQTDLQSIDTSTKSLTATVTSWDGSLLGSLGINSAAQALQTQITKANTDASAQPVQSSAQATTSINFINTTLEPDIKASLNELVSRKADFAAIGETSLVETTLQNLQSATNTYSNTLVSKAPAAQQAAAKAAAAKIAADFTTAVNAFAS